MRKVKFELKPFKEWMQNYYKENGIAPDVSELKVSNGCPFNKGIILRNFKNYTEACNACGIPSRSQITKELKEKESDKLKKAVYKFRTTDRDYLRSKGLSDRSKYERIFGSWSEALRYAGIGPKQRYLMKYFDEYNGQEPILFLKNTLGEKGHWTNEQKTLISRMKDLNGDPKLFVSKTGTDFMKRNFGYASIVQIASGFEPKGIFLKRKHKAKDGHLCDSSEEMILDNWFSDNGIEHEVQVKYPNTEMISDFLVKDIYIEYAGFIHTGLKSYKEKIERKINRSIKKKEKLIILYNLNPETLAHLKAAISSNVYGKDTELTGNPLELN